MYPSGIDISSYAPHSTKGALFFEATRIATPKQILSQENWSNLGTFKGSTIGRSMILLLINYSSKLPPVNKITCL